MGYFLTVIMGADEGRSHTIEGDQVVVGRSPSAQFVLADESVGWEHAVVARVDGKWTVNNLSAAGTRVRGKKITAPTRLAPQDEVELSPTCRLLFAEEQDASDRPSPGVLIAVGALLVLLIGVGAAYAVYAFSSTTNRPITPNHWRNAYVLLDSRLEQWTASGKMPPRALLLFRNAWRLEQVSDWVNSASNWEELNSLLLTQRESTITDDNLTLSESASPTQKALHVLMGYDRTAHATDFEWDTNNSYADALVWFARKRSTITRQLADDTGQSGKKKKKKGSK
ncbi:MAG: FHA domain-containing protein [Phycisphaerae bacterium]|nr:FHA domain-containing protein [Phycisphaerae bacterium]